ncbi:carotenoid ester lipase precursor [Auriscalpium vulgare]|uniref:Carotenoid ester lipase n=1 Tax=Auriscalpium vulgare TaxID=40419 RepID=A0ACB8RHR4_9AGAM|nr:carotenoid ester lipase precursor [Auriscalpium vulgare]
MHPLRTSWRTSPIPLTHLPPLISIRFERPQSHPPYVGNIYADAYGAACPQHQMRVPAWVNGSLRDSVNAVVSKVYELNVPQSEDCLTLNVARPAGAREDMDLPVVLVSLFQIGGASSYDGAGVVSRSVELGQPIIYISINYRCSAFGFIAGKEAKDAGIANLGLQDQRLAMHWVQKYIRRFGGDPRKVTLWGQSAGATSVSLHMLANGGETEGLFRGAVMQSGGPISVGDILDGQMHYDALIKSTGCDRSTDSIRCLKFLSYVDLKAAIDTTPNFLGVQGMAMPWLPRVDGEFIRASPQEMVRQGKVANVPFIAGNVEDEGSLFSIATRDLRTDEDVKQYLKQYILPNATDGQLHNLLRHYPSALRAGCPFGTGSDNAVGAQTKRIAAIQGDLFFHGPRRFFLKNLATRQNAWAFVSKRLKDTPWIGAAHATDLLNSFGDGELKDYIVRFVNNLDPHGNGTMYWPMYDPAWPRALMFQDDPDVPVSVGDDDYRREALEAVGNLVGSRL